MVQRLASPKRSLKSVIKLTADCNLRCHYCYQKGRFVTGKRISKETLTKILEELDAASTKPCSILWYGGEPMLYGYQRFKEAIELADQVLGQVRHAIQTNGALIDKAWAELFKKHGFSITVSLDGPQLLHDAQRVNLAGRGSHAAVIRGIKHLQEAGTNPRVACVVTSGSVAQVADLIAYFASLGVTEVDFPPAMRFLEDGRLERFVSAKEYSKFMVEAFHSWLKLNKPDFRIRSLVGLARKLKGQHGHYCKLEGDCSTYVTFTTDGDVYPCDEFSGITESSFGNIKSQPLAEILASEKARALYREWSKTPEECLSCQWQDSCPGACPFERRAAGSLTSTSALCETWKAVLPEIKALC